MDTTTELKCQSCFAPLEVRHQAGSIIYCEYCGTENALSKEVRNIVADYSHEFQVTLIYAIRDVFSSLDDLAELILLTDGYIPSSYRLYYDAICGQSVDAKSRELVVWCVRRGLLQELVDACMALRPNIDLS